MSSASEYLKNLINSFDGVKNTYESNEKKLDEIEKEIKDIEHELELASLNAVEMVVLTSDLKKLLIKRREVIDENRLLRPIYEQINKHSNFRSALNYAEMNLRKEKKEIENRYYVPRVRENLKCGKNFQEEKNRLKEKINSQKVM